MRLLDLKIMSSGQNGWESELLEFGDDITQLYGPNGSGKTPVIHSIAYALGYPVRYRDDIIAKCGSVILRVEHEDKILTFERELSKSFYLKCKSTGQDKAHVFYNERDASDFFLRELGISTVALTSNQNEPSYPYVSSFLPLFYIDQDTGYTSAYKAPSSFIKDQYSEMVRLALGVPAKHSFENKRFLIERKNELDAVNVEVVNKEKFIQRLEEQRGAAQSTSTEINIELKSLTAQLDNLRDSYDATSDAGYILKRMVREKQNEKLKLDSNIRDLESRVFGFKKIQSEIEIEINTLSLNEESRHMFTSFEDVCSAQGCGLFLGSSESYGKNLLYLRDQIKDLDRNTSFREIRLEEYREAFRKLEAEVESIRGSLQKQKNEPETTSLIAAISAITQSIIDFQGRKDLIERIESEKRDYVGLLNIRSALQNDIASLQPGTGSGDLRVLEFRTSYRKKVVEWLDVLSTKNVSRDITIDADFGVLFGTEKLSQFSGSTLLRVVLALRAAFFELFISSERNSVEFLILDTPRQHDIETKDFAAFISKLKSICKGKRAQVIFSTTEYHYESAKNDKEWLPTFDGFEQPMFLG